MKEPVRMTSELRKDIERMYNREGASVETIAAELGTTQPTIYREIRRGRTEEFNQKFERFMYDPEKGALEAARAQLNKGKKMREDDGRAMNGRKKEASA